MQGLAEVRKQQHQEFLTKKQKLYFAQFKSAFDGLRLNERSNSLLQNFYKHFSQKSGFADFRNDQSYIEECQRLINDIDLLNKELKKFIAENQEELSQAKLTYNELERFAQCLEKCKESIQWQLDEPYGNFLTLWKDFNDLPHANTLLVEFANIKSVLQKLYHFYENEDNVGQLKHYVKTEFSQSEDFAGRPLSEMMSFAIPTSFVDFLKMNDILQLIKTDRGAHTELLKVIKPKQAIELILQYTTKEEIQAFCGFYEKSQFCTEDASLSKEISTLKQKLFKETNNFRKQVPKVLSWAAENGCINLLKLLLEKGVDPNQPNNEGWSPLNSAAEKGHTEIVRLLLEKEADPNKPNNNGWSPLNSAADKGHTEIVRLLLEKEADPNKPNNNGWSPLNSAAAERHKEIVQLLLEKGADPNKPNNDGWTPLIRAVAERHTEIVQLLLEKGADPNKPNNIGWSPLNIAAAERHKEIVQLLLEKGADPNKPNNDGWTPLIRAADKGHKEIVQLLLEKGADPNKPNNDGWTPLIRAADKGHKEIVQLLLEKGADPNKPNNDGLTPLISAVAEGHKEIVQLLLEKGADPNKPPNDGWTPLIRAADKGHKEIVQLLLEKGADPNKPNNDGLTPLIRAVAERHTEIVQLLLEKGADPNKPPNDGWTPLKYAKKNKHTEIVNLLLRARVLEKQNKKLLVQYKKALNYEIQSVNILIETVSALEGAMADKSQTALNVKGELNNCLNAPILENATLLDQIKNVKTQLDHVSHLRPILEKEIRDLKSKKNKVAAPISDSGSTKQVVLPPDVVFHKLMNSLGLGIKLLERKLDASRPSTEKFNLLKDAYGNADSPQTLVGIYSKMSKAHLEPVTIEDCDKYYNEIHAVISEKLDPINSKIKASQSFLQKLREIISDSFRKITTAEVYCKSNLSTTGTINEFKNFSLIFLKHAQESIEAPASLNEACKG